MKNIIHLYITDRCSAQCPFCGLACRSQNDDFIDMKTLGRVLNETLSKNLPNTVRVIGGEPLEHPQFEGIMGALLEDKRISDVKLITNGVGFDREVSFLRCLAMKCGKKIKVRFSVNYWLLAVNGQFFSEDNLASFINEYRSPYLEFSLNIGIRKGEKEIRDKYSNLMSSLGCLANYTHLIEYVLGTNEKCDGRLYLSKKMFCPHYGEMEKFVVPSGEIFDDVDSVGTWMQTRSVYYGSQK